MAYFNPLEIAVNSTKWVPPVGTYTIDERTYSRISKPKGYK